MNETELNSDNYWINVNQGKFEVRLDFDYHEWMRDKDKYEIQFKDEIAKFLDVKPDEITINDYREGSTIVDMCLANIWRFYKSLSKKDSSDDDLTDYVRSMRVQDQIAVKYGKVWYNATIVNIWDKDGNGKHFEVRYNPRDDDKGRHPFWWNTEWIYSIAEAARLRFTNQEYLMRDKEGQDIPISWIPPPITQRESVENIRVNDHIFVKFGKKGWRRCKVYKKQRQFLGVWIKVKELKDGKTMGLNLWQEVDKHKISFIDMRRG